MGEQLSEIDVDWAYYSAVPGQVGYFWNAYNGIANVFHTDMWHEHMRPVDRHRAGHRGGASCPPVTWVTPRFELSDHPPFSTGHSHNWVTDIVNAVMRSPMWEHTAIFLTWDEWGGFYDPVMPPAGRRGRPRGPRAAAHDQSVHAPRRDRRRARASSRRRSGSSPTTGASTYLTPRIANTHNFEHVFDFTKKPRPPVLGKKRAPAYGTPFTWPGDTYPGWEAGTTPVENPL